MAKTKLVKINFSLNWADEFDMEATGIMKKTEVDNLNKKIKILGEVGEQLYVSFGSNQSDEFNYEEFIIPYTIIDNNSTQFTNSFLDNIIESIEDDYLRIKKEGISKLKSQKYKKFRYYVDTMCELLKICGIKYNKIEQYDDYSASFMLEIKEKNVSIILEKNGCNLEYEVVFPNKNKKQSWELDYNTRSFYELNEEMRINNEITEDKIFNFKYNIKDLVEFKSEKLQLTDSYTISVLDWVEKITKEMDKYEIIKDSLTYDDLSISIKNSIYNINNNEKNIPLDIKVNLEKPLFLSINQIEKFMESHRVLNYDVYLYEDALVKIKNTVKRLENINKDVKKRMENKIVEKLNFLIENEPKKIIDMCKDLLILQNAIMEA